MVTLTSSQPVSHKNQRVDPLKESKIPPASYLLNGASVGRVAPPKDAPQARAIRVAKGISPASREAAVSVSECRSTARREMVSAVPRKRTAPLQEVFETQKCEILHDYDDSMDSE